MSSDFWPDGIACRLFYEKRVATADNSRSRRSSESENNPQLSMWIVQLICVYFFCFFIQIMANFSVVPYNCEGLSPQKIKFIQDNVNQMKPSLICLQETWLLQNNSFIFYQISPQYQALCVSGVDQQSKILSGRAYGGTALLMDSGTIKSFKPVVSNSNRICGMECVVDKVMILVCSIYMPCDTQTSRVTETYIDTLNNLESLISENEYQDVLIEHRLYQE